ncbi:MAG: hypothetical protein HY021_09475 [Burkholderiales bacterium]|nr:hypothetical protein [Burkholderiales bacterium]
MKQRGSSILAGTLLAMALGAVPGLAGAQFSLKNLVPNIGVGKANTPDMTGQNDALLSGYVAANKDVLLANSQMADALGLKDAAAASRATAEALTEGATKGNLEDANKAVSASTAAVSAEIAKGPKLDAKAKATYQAGLAQLGHGLLRYIALRGPAQSFSAGVKSASPMMIPKLVTGVYIVSQLPSGVSNLATSLQNASAFAQSNDIPVPDDATKAMAAL